MSRTPSIADLGFMPSSFSDADKQSAINDAVLILEDCLSSYTDERALAVTKFVAAHQLTMLKGGQVTSKSVDGVAYSFASGNVGKNLMATTYGQQALLLDKDGCLHNLGKQPLTFRSLS